MIAFADLPERLASVDAAAVGAAADRALRRVRTLRPTRRSACPCCPDRPSPDPDIIEILETALEHARSGETIAVAVAEVVSGNHASTRWTVFDEDRTALIGAVHVLGVELTVRDAGLARLRDLPDRDEE